MVTESNEPGRARTEPSTTPTRSNTRMIKLTTNHGDILIELDAEKAP